MPADIRNFFGGSQSSQGKPATSNAKSAAKPVAKPATKGRNKRKVVSDDDEDDEPRIKKSTPKKAAPKRVAKPDSPKGEETNTSDYFGGKKSTPQQSASKTEPAAPAAPETPRRSPTNTRSISGSARSTRASTRIAARKSYADDDAEDNNDGDSKALKDDDDSGDDIYKAEFKTKGRKAVDDYEEDSDEMEIIQASKTSQTNGVGSASSRKRKPSEAAEDKAHGNKRSKATPSKVTSAKATPKKPAKTSKADGTENPEIQDIFDNIQQVRPPTPPARDGSKKFNFAANAQRATNQGVNPGAADIPDGQENCLAGLSFVFTGILQSLGREEGQNLVKRYGGKVMGAPSKNTTFVVLGSDAGPKKLEVIAQHKIKTIDENGLFELIRQLPANGGSGKAAEKAAEKKAKEEEKILKAAVEEEKEFKARNAEQKKTGAAAAASSGQTTQRKRDLNDELWTVKYAPSALNQICGNKTQVEKLQNWLRNWHRNAKRKFKVGGPDGSGLYRAAILSGGPGIGKTTSAHLVAKLEGYDIVETNASDTRSKKLVEQGLRGVLDTTSLLGYFAGDGKKVEAEKKKLVLIMDEVDGMSAGDRGGVGALASVCRKTSIPLILICNERNLPKMKPFDGVTFGLPFRKPTTDQVRSRIMTILFREGMRDLIPLNTINALIEGTNADIRQVINMISTAKIDQEALGYDDGKKMAKAWEKNVILKPWDITHKILSAGMFAPSSKATLNDKIELYFNDHEFSSLMLQENYIKTRPAGANNYEGRERKLKVLELMDQAAESISDGDMVDRMIHGNQQQWSLMPTHAVFSFVRPASFANGALGGQVSFTSYLGNLSKTGKLARFVKEIQSHMRLRASADRHDIRQQYMPMLWQRIVKRLEQEGSEPHVIDDIIELMDSYFLTKEDWDAILELGVGACDMESIKVPTNVKSSFTRKYNSNSHPLPFMKATSSAPVARAPKEKPDLEEAFEESDEGEVLADPAAEEGSDTEELDLKKDKYVQAPKKKKAPAKKSAGKGKGKGKGKPNDDDDEEDEEEVIEKPKAKSKSKGKGGKAKK